MTQTIVIKRLTFGSLFKLIFISLAMGLAPFGILSGIAGTFGANAISLWHQPVHGWMALVAGFVIGPVVAFCLTVFWSVFAFFGLWLYSLFRSVRIEFCPASEGGASDTKTIGLSSNPSLS